MFDEGLRTAEPRWISVVFLQGDEAHAVLGMIDLKGAIAAIEHLQQWDYGDETIDAALTNGYVYDRIPAGRTDRIIEDDGSPYALTYSKPFSYVSLLRRYPEEPEPNLVRTSRVTSPQPAQSRQPAATWASTRVQSSANAGQAVSL
ncbi:hypothetical protein C3B61_15705 [Cryobacterium zongtaii]|uniref:Uncharacterized protein n=1 Tax=Cryobacterium zongtaii TaxID=1259217 RepID=A0A2S3Z9V3_9MICO|nr:hypothetical protein [Cryobacterium zongtaii]POH62324.1 hypothetical protein C3B61_15705 [Cryobacterium zongtaii]